MAEVSQAQVLDALKSVKDPDSGTDIVTHGMVSGLVVKDGNIGFSIEVDPKRGPHLDSLRHAAEKAVEAAEEAVEAAGEVAEEAAEAADEAAEAAEEAAGDAKKAAE